ncbi:MAG: diaminopimelate epimerase, partial [Candidatus Omnitrophica bacterium]|nr:diaminopimelate epimerase [Candidatus Omnitrophota bacterium]
AEMCGNGSRCITLFAQKILGLKAPFKMETPAGIIGCEIHGVRIKVKLTEPRDFRFPVSINVEGRKFKVAFINMGVPHVVYFPKQVEGYPVRAIGRVIRTHQAFAPRGANVNFVQVDGVHHITVRTYERGVEDETLACGTGVSASSVVSAIEHGVQSPVKVLTRGGEVLRVYFTMKKGFPAEVYLEGKAGFIFKGELDV